MHTKDILSLSFRNLYRRKGRTLLTISGVVIGCCAVVIMVSMGIGMKQSQEEMLASMGNLRQITVTPYTSKSAKRALLNKEAVKKIKAIENVESAVAKKTLDLGDLYVTAGDQARYQCNYATIVGISDEDLKNAGYIITEGKNLGKKEGEVLVGNHLVYQFADSKRPDGKNYIDYWEDENAKPFFDILKTNISISQQKEQSTGSEDNSNSSGNTGVIWNTIRKLTPVGVLKQDYDVGDETDSGIVMRMKDFERLEKEVKKVTHGTVSKEYSQVNVNVTDISKVAEVEEQIQTLGFETSSMESIRKPMEQSVQQKQLMLAGLGAVSLFVAAIGIANTMIMSITERTREIGVMKALGCDLNDIRKEFLTEAALIGLLGGIVGSAVSCGVSWLMNTFSGVSLTDSTLIYAADSMSGASQLSVIPVWLMGSAVLFSVLMGVAAGFLPANRAVHISALEAMKE